MTVPGVATTIEGIYELSTSAPITTIDIGGREFALGNLYPNQREEIARIGNRIIEAAHGGPPLTKNEANPTIILSALLLAGDPGLDLKTFWRDVRPEHVLIANKEYQRQAYSAALADTKGSA